MKERNRNPRVERMARTCAQTRTALGLSQRELSRLSAVSASTIRKLEQGRHVDDALVIRLATTMLVLEHQRRKPASADLLDTLLPVSPPRPTLLRPPVRTLGGAA